MTGSGGVAGQLPRCHCPPTPRPRLASTATRSLALDRDADLARRASEVIGSPEFEVLARRVGVSGRDLLCRALAWQYGGPDGLKVLADPWQPVREDLGEGRRALGAGVRAKDNRLTTGDRQLRFGTD